MSNPDAENNEAAEAAVEASDVAVEEQPAEVSAETLAAVADAEAPAEAAHSPVPSPANDPALLRRALEGLLFITDRPLSAGELCKLVNVRDQDKIVACVEELRAELEDRNLGYRLIAVAEGWQMATRPELAPYMRKLFSDRATMRLSTAAQETLSIISYKQPLTRAEVEEIRGVEVIAALETLLEKRLIKVVGRKETVGRPLMYGTTMEFLRHFGLRSLEDLPPLDRFSPAEAAAGENSAISEEAATGSEQAFVRSDEEAPLPAPEDAPAETPVVDEAPAAEPSPASEETPAPDSEGESEGLWPK